MKLSVARKLIDENTSTDCKKKLRKMAQYMGRLTRKDNAYVQMRDAIVVSLTTLLVAYDNANNTLTTIIGHQRLDDLLGAIFEPEESSEPK